MNSSKDAPHLAALFGQGQKIKDAHTETWRAGLFRLPREAGWAFFLMDVYLSFVLIHP